MRIVSGAEDTPARVCMERGCKCQRCTEISGCVAHAFACLEQMGHSALVGAMALACIAPTNAVLR